MTRVWPWLRARSAAPDGTAGAPSVVLADAERGPLAGEPGAHTDTPGQPPGPPAVDPERELRERRRHHSGLHHAAAREVVWREPGIDVVIGPASNPVDAGVQPNLEAALAMVNDVLLRHAGITTARISLGPSRWVELDRDAGWQTRLDGRAFPEAWTPPVPWAPTVDRSTRGRERLVPGVTPDDITHEPGLEAVVRRIDERCPSCRGTHALGDVDVADLVYLALGHGLHFPGITDAVWAADPGDGRC